jgi:hypothetical protein
MPQGPRIARKRGTAHIGFGTLSAIWAAFILAVVAYNHENLSATFGGLEGHPLLLVVTAYIIGPPLVIYLVGSILVWIGRGFSRH